MYLAFPVVYTEAPNTWNQRFPRNYTLWYDRRATQREFETILTKNKTKGEKMKNKSVLFLVQGAAIAAIYVILTFVFSAFAFGEIQVRLSEALTILPVFIPAAIPGLFVGCILGNILGGAILPDIIFGSLATLIGALLTYRLRKKPRYIAVLPPILSNAIIVPFILRYGYGVNLPIWSMMLTVGAGEVISCGILGILLAKLLDPYASKIFPSA